MKSLFFIGIVSELKTKRSLMSNDNHANSYNYSHNSIIINISRASEYNKYSKGKVMIVVNKEFPYRETNYR
jgi:hypothetical protein